MEYEEEYGNNEVDEARSNQAFNRNGMNSPYTRGITAPTRGYYVYYPVHPSEMAWNPHHYNPYIYYPCVNQYPHSQKVEEVSVQRDEPVSNNREEESNHDTTQYFLQQFLDENGQVDIQKMLTTIGQFADTVQQVSPVIKQLNDLVRNFRA